MSDLPLDAHFSKARPVSGIKYFIVLQALLVTPLLLSLSYWQLSRSQEKQQTLARFNTAATVSEPSSITRFSRVQLSGYWLQDTQLLLDNRTHQGQAGYHLLALLKTHSAHFPVDYYLVDLGWIRAEADRTQLPTLTLPDTLVSLTARADIPAQPLLLQADHWPEQWPKRIQAIDIPRLSALLNLHIAPWVLHPETPQVAGIAPNWQPIQMTPERHQGYAVQWLGLALVWLLGSVIWFAHTSRRTTP